MSSEIIEWSRTSVYGLVLLGAVGSILAIILLKLLNYIFKPLLHKAILSGFKYTAKQNWMLGYLSATNDVSKVSIYVVYHLMSFILAIAVAHLSIEQLIVRLSINMLSTLNAMNLIFMTLFILSMFIIVLKFWVMAITYRVHVLSTLGGKYADSEEKDGDANDNGT